MPVRTFVTLMLIVIFAAAATVAVVAQLPSGALVWVMPLFAGAAWLVHRYRR